MMFRSIAFLSALKAASAGKAVEVPTANIPATSKLGSRILSASRQLDGGDDEYSWIAGYSLKFQKCATSDDYYGGYFGGEENGGGNQANYNGMYKQRLVHYKLCPTGTCDSGCDNGADYVIDMGLFVEAYIESKLDAQEYNCEMVRENCYYDDEYQCYAQAGLDYCMDNDNNNNNGNNGQQQFQLEDAMECQELEVDDEALQYYYYQQSGNNNGQYNNNGNNNNNNNNQEMKLYVGPYCSSNGKQIYLGTFMDETCSYPAPSGTYENFNYGQALPYSADNKESLIDDDCVSCKEPQDQDDQNDGDQDDADEALEVCERLYEDAGKCESGLESGVTYYPNTYSCDFIETLQAPGKMAGESGSSIAASKVFAGLFAATTVLFAGVSYHLYQKTSRSNVNLNSQGTGALA